MASLSAVSLSADINFIKQPAETKLLQSTIKINKIEDYPAEKVVMVHVEDVGHFVLDDLSGINYDTPSEWTNDSVKKAVLKYLQINS
jgi:hypothetical protein